MGRVKFKKGEQRKFIQRVLNELNCPSLRGFLQFGLDVNYSSLKNYFVESRLIPRKLFEEMLYLSKINIGSLEVEYLGENWGKIRGGKKRKK